VPLGNCFIGTSEVIHKDVSCHKPADKFVGLVQSKPTSLCYILQNKFVGLVPSQPTNLSAGSWRFLFKELGYFYTTPKRLQTGEWMPRMAVNWSWGPNNVKNYWLNCELIMSVLHTGLPDFSWFNVPKRGKIPNCHLITKFPNIHSIYIPTVSRASKIYAKWDFWFENTHTIIWQPDPDYMHIHT
jgi:hypothetical protein